MQQCGPNRPRGSHNERHQDRCRCSGAAQRSDRERETCQRPDAWLLSLSRSLFTLLCACSHRGIYETGDLVLDPFVGGGTTLVEARVLGRPAIGVDINRLAIFVTRAKTTLLSETDFDALAAWSQRLHRRLNLRTPANRPAEWLRLGYQRNTSGRQTWPVRKMLELALATIGELPRAQQRRFARCALLKTAQWALDCRRHVPPAWHFRRQLLSNLNAMANGARQFSVASRAADRRSRFSGPFRTLCLHHSAVGMENHPRISDSLTPRIILTSPPYPGVHVIYHRWQVLGRRETPAPFWVANCLDGNSESFYTFGDRKQEELAAYYDQALAAFRSISRIAGKETIWVQLLSFADPSWQLGKYLEVMEQAGFSEITFRALANSADGRLWRHVPNRKWYADQKATLATSREVVLFHRLA